MSRVEQQLEWLLGYQLRMATRHRYFVSLVMVAVCARRISVRLLLDETLRASDEFFDLEEGTAIVMAHTGMEEAQEAIARYKSRCNGEVDLRFSIVTYPGDMGAVPDMLMKARQRLAIAKQLHCGAVLSSDDIPFSEEPMGPSGLSIHVREH